MMNTRSVRAGQEAPSVRLIALVLHGSPLEVLPESRGYKRLANAVDVLGPYQAVSGAGHTLLIFGSFFLMIPAM